MKSHQQAVAVLTSIFIFSYRTKLLHDWREFDKVVIARQLGLRFEKDSKLKLSYVGSARVYCYGFLLDFTPVSQVLVLLTTLTLNCLLLVQLWLIL